MTDFKPFVVSITLGPIDVFRRLVGVCSGDWLECVPATDEFELKVD